MIERYGQVTIIAWGFSFNSFMPSFYFSIFLFLFFSFSFLFSFSFFFFFSNYLQNKKIFDNKNNQIQIISQSPVDSHNLWGDNSGSTWGWYFPCEVPRILVPVVLKISSQQPSLVLFSKIEKQWSATQGFLFGLQPTD